MLIRVPRLVLGVFVETGHVVGRTGERVELVNEVLGIGADVRLERLPEAPAADVVLRQEPEDEREHVGEPVGLPGRQEDVELAVEPRHEPVRAGRVLPEELGRRVAEAVRHVGERTDPQVALVALPPEVARAGEPGARLARTGRRQDALVDEELAELLEATLQGPVFALLGCDSGPVYDNNELNHFLHIFKIKLFLKSSKVREND